MGKVLEFKPKQKELTKDHRPSEPEEGFTVRMARIRTSLDRINRLMAELKLTAAELKGESDAKMS